MALSLDSTIALVPILPFLAALLAPWIHRLMGHYAGWVLAIVPAAICYFFITLHPIVLEQGAVFATLEWVPAYNLFLTYYVDGLSLLFGLLISGIGTIIVLYSGYYLKGHHHQGRFFSFILMFMGSMLGLVLADNMIVLFIFWELTSITSFLLIGFDHTRQASRRAAIQALVVTNAGGLALLAGILLLHIVTIEIDLSGTGTWSLFNIMQVEGLLAGHPLLLPILLLFLAGAFTKSAQFPFHFWLPNAMEAPTPVSAFLHSATMVKAGVYLLARMAPTFANETMMADLPILGETEVYLWNILLVSFGGVTLLYGATLALRQTDMKQMLAQTTVASLGLLVLLIGINNELAAAGVILYLTAHAFYKAALFLVAGIIDHEAGTREITDLGGMRGLMPVTFVAAILAALSMAGLPPMIGFFAKEEMYAALAAWDWLSIVVLVVLILGNAFMLVVGAAIAIKPFMGGLKPTPLKPHEAPFGMYVGPVLFGLLALVAGLMPDQFGYLILERAASAIYFEGVHNHLKLELSIFFKPIILLSILTWAIGAALYWKLDDVRRILKTAEERINWNFDLLFDQLMFGLIRLSDAITRVWHHGRLELYLIVVFIGFAVALLAPLLILDVPVTMPAIPDMTFYEWGVMAIAVLGLIAVTIARTRLVAIVSLGIQGFAVALIFMLFGAPDLSFTQFMVETLSVVILALVMTRLHLEQRDFRVLEELLRDGTLALLCGVGVTGLLWAVLDHPLDTRLTDFFAATSVAIAHGHNIVNVILVDYRGLDTLGEISVVMTAGIAILALIRIRAGGPQTGIGALKKDDKPKSSRKPAAKRTSAKSAASRATSTKSTARKPRTRKSATNKPSNGEAPA